LRAPFGVLALELCDLNDRFHSTNPSDGPAGAIHAQGGSGDDQVVGGSAGNFLNGGEGNDALTGGALGGESNALNGGAGDDRVIGGPGMDELNGGGGRDEIFGRGGADRMTDGDRDGAVGEAAPGPDLLDGGSQGCCSNGDQVSYRRRTAPVFVNLSDRDTEGEAGEGDVLRGIESLEGGTGDDRLVGDDRGNMLLGRTGTDRLSGRGGKDTLVPGRGGGPIACGDGTDLVQPSSSLDQLDADCEQLYLVHLFIYGMPAYPRQVGPSELDFRAQCPENIDDAVEAPVERCSGVVQVREARGGGRLLATGGFPLGLWVSRSVSLRLTPLGRRLASRHHGVQAIIRLAVRVPGHGTAAARWGIRLGLTS